MKNIIWFKLLSPLGYYPSQAMIYTQNLSYKYSFTEESFNSKYRFFPKNSFKKIMSEQAQ